MKTRLRYTLIAGLAAVGLGLAGCGGGGGGNLSNEIRDLKSQLAAAQDAKTAADAKAAAAEAAKAAADEARTAAEAAQAAAEAAQMTAESERDASNAAAMAAAAAQAAAEAAQAEAEAAEAAAKAAQAAAESAQATAEDERDAAKAAETAALAAQTAAEMAQAAAEARATAAEAAKAAADAERDAANTARMAAEAAKTAAEAAQAQAETNLAAAVSARMSAEAARDEAVTARNAAQMALETARTDLGTAQANLEQAQRDLEAARSDDTTSAARIAELEGQVTSLTTERDTARGDVTRLEGEVSDLEGDVSDKNDEIARLTTMIDGDGTDENPGLKAQLAAVQEELADLKEELAEKEIDQAKDERIARAGGVRTSIATAANRVSALTALPRWPSTASGVEAGTGVADEQVTVRYAGGMVTVDVNGATEDQYTGGTVPASSGAWNKVTMTRDPAGGTTTDTLVIYTEAPRDILFTSRYAATVRSDVLANTSRTDDLPTSRLIASSQFPAGGDSRTFDGSTSRPKSFRGTFDGVPGVFACGAAAGTSCTISTSVAANGVVTYSDSAQTWTFTPDQPNTAMVKDSRQYGHFGWWLNKPDRNSTPHMVEVFAGATNPVLDADTANIAAVTAGSSASYSGQAAGKYATTTSSAGVQTDAAVGHFTATANLRAVFGAAGNDPATQGISGSISGFVLDDQDSVPWSVTLEASGDYGTDGTFTGTTEVDFGGGSTTNAVGATHPGAWRGQFFNADSVATRAPRGVVGVFDAVTDSAAIKGAFGAHRQ